MDKSDLTYTEAPAESDPAFVTVTATTPDGVSTETNVPAMAINLDAVRDHVHGMLLHRLNSAEQLDNTAAEPEQVTTGEVPGPQ